MQYFIYFLFLHYNLFAHRVQHSHFPAFAGWSTLIQSCYLNTRQLITVSGFPLVISYGRKSRTTAVSWYMCTSTSTSSSHINLHGQARGQVTAPAIWSGRRPQGMKRMLCTRCSVKLEPTLLIAHGHTRFQVELCRTPHTFWEKSYLWLPECTGVGSFSPGVPAFYVLQSMTQRTRSTSLAWEQTENCCANWFRAHKIKHLENIAGMIHRLHTQSWEITKTGGKTTANHPTQISRCVASCALVVCLPQYSWIFYDYFDAKHEPDSKAHRRETAVRFTAVSIDSRTRAWELVQQQFSDSSNANEKKGHTKFPRGSYFILDKKSKASSHILQIFPRVVEVPSPGTGTILCSTLMTIYIYNLNSERSLYLRTQWYKTRSITKKILAYSIVQPILELELYTLNIRKKKTLGYSIQRTSNQLECPQNKHTWSWQREEGFQHGGGSLFAD